MCGDSRFAVLRFHVALALFCLTSLPVSAQYFGQNKVRYETLDFKVLKTDNFDLHYYDEFREAAVVAGRLAERWHERLSKILGHKLPPNQPVVFYASHPAFRATTVIPDFIGEATGGVTEGLRRRVVMPMAGPLAETDHVLGHELVHAFQFDITSRIGPQAGSGLPGALRLPLWFVEGMAEYLSVGPADSHTAMWMRDAVRREDLPTIRRLDHPRYFPYRFGQAFWAYVAGRYGDEVVGQILKAAGRTGSAEGAISGVLNISADELSKQWHEALFDQYEPVLKVTGRPEEHGRLLVSSEQHGGDINVSPVLSPDGRHMIFFSERELFSIDLFLADAETGQIRRKITETAIDPHFESLQFVNSAGAWSPDGSLFAIAAISRGRPDLSFYDVEKNRFARRIRFRELGEILNPTWSPDGRFVAFSAVVEGYTDLFVADLESEALRRLTHDAFAALQPAWSPDGTRIVFVTDRFTSNLDDLAFGEYRLAAVDVKTGKIEPVRAFPSGKHISPQWSADGQNLYFLSDRDGVPNIYRLSWKDRRIHQVTNLQTGVSGISKLSPAFSVAAKADRLAFSVFQGGNYSIYLMHSREALAGRPPDETVARLGAGVLPPRVRPEEEVPKLLAMPQVGLVPPDQFATTNYRARLELDYIAPPNIAVGMSNFGTLVGGGTALYWSDLLGFHNLMTAFQTATTSDGTNFFRNISAIAAYQNKKRRWTWGLIGGQIPFVTGGFGQAVGVIDGQPVLLEQTVQFWQMNREIAGTLAYPFNRAQRIEFTGGYRNIGFAAEQTTRAFSQLTGALLFDERQSIPTPDSLNLGTGSAALVYDTSLFGGTSPIMGQRYRLEFGAVGGGVSYSTLLGDYRHYWMPVRPFTLAGRLLHFGRYGGDAEDDRLQDLFLGYPSLVRGYDPNSFSVIECGPDAAQTGRCPVFDQLLGSRMGVANAELRIPLLGFLGVIPSRGFLPVESALFYDAGIAWTRAEKATFLNGPRQPVSSYGVSLRLNILGFAVGQISYVRPIDRPLKSHVWEFSLVPGF